MTRSLKRRLLGWTTGGMVLLLAVFATVLYVAIERALNASFNESLAITAKAIAASVKQEDAKVEVEFLDQEMPEFHRADRPAYYELWLADGSVLKRSASLGGQDLARTAATPAGPPFRAIALPDGRPGRAVAVVFQPRLEDEQDEENDGKDAKRRTPRPPAAAQEVTLVVARGTADLDSQLASLRWLLAAAGAGTVLLVLLVAAIVVRQGLRPLRSLAAGIASIREDDLSARLPAQRTVAEVVPVVERLNELLGRLQEAFRRERTLTADVAHELRTPLAGMRSTIDVALSRSRAPREYEQALRDCQEIVRQTQGMVDNLLCLARLEDGQVALRLEGIRLAELVDLLWLPHAQQARARRIVFENRLPADARCTADRNLLTMVTSNLLANAAEYTNEGGRIEVSGAVAANALEVAFRNSGCTLSPEDAPHVFDRFWRGDAARSATGVHCGLGLSLIKRAVHALGGAVAAEVADGRFTVRVTLPC
ncbi:MAG: HAMP domain-containing protein [Planctomycetes bacterium]|nr:HAMP domain-containing protein [Planctomycetota bacterium]